MTGTAVPGGHRPGSPDCLLDRVRTGDREAVAELYLTYAGRVERCAARILDDPQDAQDVTHEVFVKLMTRMDRYERRSVPFGAWLMRVAHNEAIDHRRRRRCVPCADVAEREREDGEGTLRTAELLQALATLPPEQRRVVVLRHVAGYSPSEIAAGLGRTEASVNGLQHRGCVALRRELSDLLVAA